MAWTEKIELAAAHGEPMLDGLTAPERMFYISRYVVCTINTAWTRLISSRPNVRKPFCCWTTRERYRDPCTAEPVGSGEDVRTTGGSDLATCGGWVQRDLGDT